LRFVCVSLFIVRLLCAQTPIQVANAASGDPAAIAPGSLIRISLTPMGGPITPIDSNMVSVVLSPAGSAQPLSADPFSVVALLSSDVPLGAVDITLNFNGQSSAPAHVTVVPTGFGLFDVRNSLTSPAKPGDALTLWGTGLGSATQDEVSVLVGGHMAAVTYAGPAPGLLGTDQINFTMPDDPAIPEGCYVAVEVRAAAWMSNVRSLSASRDGSACKSPFGFTGDQLAQLDAGQNVVLAQVNLYDMVGHPPPLQWFDSIGYTRMEHADALFLELNAQNLASLTMPLRAEDAAKFCYTARPGTVGILARPGASAGDALTLTSDSKSLKLTTNGISSYSAQLPTPAPVDSPKSVPPPFFSPGTWTVTAPGSTNMQPFTSSLEVPPPVHFTLDGHTIHWNGSDYSSDWNAEIYTNTNVCIAPGDAGQFTLQSLDGVTYIELLLTPKPDRITHFNAQLTDGTSIPVLFRYYPSETVTLN
jgi:uncharacterized protein (TIGR03437 family)